MTPLDILNMFVLVKINQYLVGSSLLGVLALNFQTYEVERFGEFENGNIKVSPLEVDKNIKSSL